MKLNLTRIWMRLVLRFCSRHRRKTIAVGGFIVIGTATLVLLYGITTGINDCMVMNSTHLHSGHGLIALPDTRLLPALIPVIRKESRVADLLPRHRSSGLLTGEKGAVPVNLFGVDPEKEFVKTAVSQRLTAGVVPGPESRRIMVGSGIADALSAKTGDILTFNTGSGVGLAGIEISGIFETGIEYFDNTTAFMPIGGFTTALQRASTAEIAVFFSHPEEIRPAAARIQQQLPAGISLRTWDELLPDLVQLIEMNTISMMVIMTLVYLLVGFGISNTVILTVMERYREFGILKALGITPNEMVFLVFLENFMVCLLATLAGLAIGGAMVAIAAHFGIDFSQWTSHNRYFVVTGVVRPRITVAGLLWPGLLSVMVSVGAAYFPSRIAGKRTAADMLRFS
ncbi:MAG: ABC transporter permease [Desulfobacteraceae bacterium]|nr:ABC transporter permease [Desulfobacteraceae bacterium]